MGQKGNVRIGNEESKIGEGVREGCCMSPTLFNIYFDNILQKAMKSTQGTKEREYGALGRRDIIFMDDVREWGRKYYGVRTHNIFRKYKMYVNM